MSQKDRILSRLNLGLMCSMEPLDWQPRIYRVAARVLDLRPEGYDIVTVECEHHGGASHAAYVLESANQRTLFS